MDPNRKPLRLETWKAIAEYLGRDVTTAIRWEREKGLPVRRQLEGKRQTVFALTNEIDDWWLLGEASPDSEMSGGEPADKVGRALQELAEGKTIQTFPAPAATPKSRSTTSTLKKALLVATIALSAISAIYVKVRSRNSAKHSATAETLTFKFPGSVLRFQKTVIPLRGRGDLRAVDLNHDGVLDLVIGGSPGDELEVLMGRGNGTFAPAQIYQGCPASSGPDVADLDNDGGLDIVAACYDAGSIAIWWGTGNGIFQSEPSRISVGRRPWGVRIADLNHDGLPDIVADSVGSTKISVLINQGSRRFARHDYDVGFPSRTLVIADLDGDGNLDVLSGCSGERCQIRKMLKGNGDGSFQVVDISSFGEGNFQIGKRDQNSNDLIVVARDWRLLLFHDLGNGRYATPVTLKQAASPMMFVSADFGGDGKNDLAVVLQWANRLSFLKRTGDQIYVESNEYETDSGPYYPVAGDFNGDGCMDLVFTTRDNYGSNLWVLLQIDSTTTPH